MRVSLLFKSTAPRMTQFTVLVMEVEFKGKGTNGTKWNACSFLFPSNSAPFISLSFLTSFYFITLLSCAFILLHYREAYEVNEA